MIVTVTENPRKVKLAIEDSNLYVEILKSSIEIRDGAWVVPVRTVEELKDLIVILQDVVRIREGQELL